MSRLDDTCGSLFQHVEGAVLCAVVDLDSGVVVGLHPGGSDSRGSTGVLAVAATRLVRGVVVGDLIRGLKRVTATVTERSPLEECQLTTSEHSFFCRTIGGGRALVMLVTNREVSAGMGWAQLNAAVPRFESAVV